MVQANVQAMALSDAMFNTNKIACLTLFANADLTQTIRMPLIIHPKGWARGPVRRTVVATNLTAKAVTKQAVDLAHELDGLIAGSRRDKLIP